jgi:hypothetical protein
MEKLKTEPKKTSQSGPSYKKLLSLIVSILALLVIGVVAYVAYLYFASPSVIRNPYLQHYHFRSQIIVDGVAQNFADAKYQTPESNVSCDAALPAEPIHFHDNKNQITHVHWDGMTGGLFLKDYGLNYIGGIDNALGYRFDHLPHLVKVPTHGHLLPTPAAGDNFYVYSGNQTSYRARSFNDFLHQDFETFFGKTSNLKSTKPTSMLNSIFPKAYAAQLDQEQLTFLNNLIGNVVIFVQKQKPTDAQIKDRFSHLEPLSESVCGS